MTKEITSSKKKKSSPVKSAKSAIGNGLALAKLPTVARGKKTHVEITRRYSRTTNETQGIGGASTYHATDGMYDTLPNGSCSSSCNNNNINNNNNSIGYQHAFVSSDATYYTSSRFSNSGDESEDNDSSGPGGLQVFDPNPWSLKAPEDIYDLFHQKGLKLGVIANRVLNELISRDFILRSDKGKQKLAKGKVAVQKEREEFRNMSSRGVEKLRDFLFLNGATPEGKNTTGNTHDLSGIDSDSEDRNPRKTSRRKSPCG